MPRISVIVPVYNVEQYLPACVDSILGQTFEDFELLLVDDGSPDNCGAICDAYAQKDPRVRVIHQENRGLSGARNAAMDVAKGEYITFVDSDDFVSRDYLEVLLSGIISQNADISCCKLLDFQDGESLCSIVKPPIVGSTSLLSGRDAVLHIYGGSGQVSICACGKLYRKELFGGIRFPLRKLHEDQAVVPILLYKAQCVAVMDVSNYYYRTRPDSITHKAFKSNRFDNIEAIDSCVAFFRDRGDQKLTAAAMRIRKKVNALLVILAHSQGAKAEIPPAYRIGLGKAVYHLYRYAPDDTFSWYLSQLDPRRIRLHAYMLKIRKMLKHGPSQSI